MKEPPSEYKGTPKPRRGRMHPEMAKAVVKAYAANGYNATQAAKSVGYAASTAEVRGFDIVRIATQRIIEAAAKESKGLSLRESRSLIELMGLKEEEVKAEYVKIIGQDKDLATKLRAITPLMGEIDSRFSDSEKVAASPVNITVERVNTFENKGNIDNVAQDSFRDTIRDIAVEDSPADATPEAPTSPVAESE